MAADQQGLAFIFLSSFYCRAMGGQVLFQDALAARLELIKPTKTDIEACLMKHPLKLTKGVQKVVELLHARGTPVYLVSGGFRQVRQFDIYIIILMLRGQGDVRRQSHILSSIFATKIYTSFFNYFFQMINPVAEALKIPLHRVYANNLIFNEDGSFQGFDPSEPTSRDGGKPAVIQSLKDAHGYETVVMVGDGATDMQARPPASAFIGFGGVVVRDSVKAGADWFVTDFQVLLTSITCPGKLIHLTIAVFQKRF